METIAAKTMRRLQRTFEKRARAQFGERLQKLEWLDDDLYEPSGERVAGLLHAALHIKRAKPQDSSLSTSIAYQVMADFNDIEEAADGVEGLETTRGIDVGTKLEFPGSESRLTAWKE